MEGERAHQSGVHSAHDRHGHVHQHAVELGGSLAALQNGVHRLLAVAGQLDHHAQGSQHHLGHFLVDEIVLRQQYPSPLHTNILSDIFLALSW